MIPKVCENKGKYTHFLQNAFFAIFKQKMLFLKLPPTKCEEFLQLRRGGRKPKPSPKETGFLYPSTSENMLIGTMKMFLLLEIFHYAYC